MIAPLSIWVIPAYYDLAQAENRMLVEWLLPLSERGLIACMLQFLRIRHTDLSVEPSDVRYLLAASLLNPRVQSSFDLVIIDSPPRLTTSHIQAMCASTHLLVPTILDGLSGDAVARYLDQIAVHKNGPNGVARRAICPYLQPVGVVCTLVPRANADLSGRITVLQQRIAAAPIRPVVELTPEDCFIKQRTPYRDHAGELLAYAALSNDEQHRDLRAEVDRLGDWIAPRIGAQARGWSRRETE
jgi:chromosome partitioning protein